MTIGDSASLQIRTLGRFEVFIDGVPIPEDRWPRRKAKELLKVLLTDPGRPFTFEQLVDALLPEADITTATNNIQARVSELRRVLEPELSRGRDSKYVVSFDEGYAFDPSCKTPLDFQEFETAAAEAERLTREGRPREAAERFEEAMLLYRGDFLAEDRYAEWAEGTRSRLRDRCLEGLEDLASCYVELGRFRQAISCCQRVLGIAPYRESVIRQLMEYQDRIGQRSQALETFHEGVRALREQLAVDPSPETMALQARIAQKERSSGNKLDPKRVAVLPFANFSASSEDDYLADGLTEELIGHLSRVRDLRVLARTSVMRFRDTTDPIGPIARELGVGTLLEGSVRKVDENIRISAQLIDAATEEHVWANEYSGPAHNLLAFQQEVAREVAQSLEVVLFRDEAPRPVRQTPETSEAYSLYLRARVFGQQGTAQGQHKALACCQEAISLDPQLAAAHAAIGRYYTVMSGWEDAEGKEIPPIEAYAKARLALLRALEIDPDLPEAHASLGLFQAVREHRFDDAERSYKRAIYLNPSYPRAHGWYSVLLLCMNRNEEALAEARRRTELDPVSPGNHVHLVSALMAVRRFDDATRLIDQALEMYPSYPIHAAQAKLRWLLWDWEGGLVAAEEQVRKMPMPGHGPWYRGRYFLYLGQVAKSLAEFESEGMGSIGDKRNRLEYGLTLYHAREYERLVALMDELIETDPFGVHYAGKSWYWLLRGLALERLGEDHQALSALREAQDGLPESILATFSRGPILADVAEALIRQRLGEDEAVRQAIDRLARRSHENEVASALAILHFQTGELDEGFEWLDRALQRHDDFLLTIKTHPWFDPVRSDPRFRSALTRMNLAD